MKNRYEEITKDDMDDIKQITENLKLIGYKPNFIEEICCVEFLANDSTKFILFNGLINDSGSKIISICTIDFNFVGYNHSDIIEICNHVNSIFACVKVIYDNKSFYLSARYETMADLSNVEQFKMVVKTAIDTLTSVMNIIGNKLSKTKKPNKATN